MNDTIQHKPIAWIYERQNGGQKLVFIREPHDKSIIKETPLFSFEQVKEMTDFAFENGFLAGSAANTKE